MDFLGKVLNYYNLTREDYAELTKEVKQEDLLCLADFEHGQKSLECLKKHMENSSKILIYGDYDCDGMMATSILNIAFNKIGYTNIGYCVPNRYTDGYGLNIEKVKQFIEKNYKLIICVDNGISQFEAIKFARENGIEVIICDHHEVKEELPDTPYIIHPAFSNAKTYCSGGYTSFVLAWGLLGYFDEYIFALAAISIISDLMILQHENRKIVKYALGIFNKRSFVQIDKLAENNHINENVIGGLISPKINSIGRLIDNYNVNLVVKYFSSTDKNEINRLHSYIEAVNTQRKSLAANYNFETIEVTENNAIIELLDVKEGLIGLFANKILDLYNKPAIVFSKTNEDGVLKGSARSKPGISILELFSAVDDLLLAAGGHECAGGFSIKEENFEEFKNRIVAYCNEKSFKESLGDFIEIGLNDITLENLEILENLSPFGNGFKAPEFKISNFPSKSFGYSYDGNHIITKLSINSSLVCFNYNPEALKGRYVDFVGSFRANYFKNRKNVNFVIKKLITKE